MGKIYLPTVQVSASFLLDRRCGTDKSRVGTDCAGTVQIPALNERITQCVQYLRMVRRIL